MQSARWVTRFTLWQMFSWSPPNYILEGGLVLDMSATVFAKEGYMQTRVMLEKPLVPRRDRVEILQIPLGLPHLRDSPSLDSR